MSDQNERLDRIFLEMGGMKKEIDLLLQSQGKLVVENRELRQDMLEMPKGDGSEIVGIRGRVDILLKRVDLLSENLGNRLTEAERRITQLEDCYTAPERQEDGPDPKVALYEKILEGVKKHHPLNQGEAQQKQFASRLTNALWKAKVRSPEKIAAATDQRLRQIKGVGYRYGISVLRATFPRAL